MGALAFQSDRLRGRCDAQLHLLAGTSRLVAADDQRRGDSSGVDGSDDAEALTCEAIATEYYVGVDLYWNFIRNSFVQRPGFDVKFIFMGFTRRNRDIHFELPHHFMCLCPPIDYFAYRISFHKLANNKWASHIGIQRLKHYWLIGAIYKRVAGLPWPKAFTRWEVDIHQGRFLGVLAPVAQPSEPVAQARHDQRDARYTERRQVLKIHHSSIGSVRTSDVARQVAVASGRQPGVAFCGALA
jgi:hypothetical protein